MVIYKNILDSHVFNILLLVTQETPLTRVRITDVRGNSHRPLTSSPPPCLPSEGQKRREGQSVPLALAGS